MPPFLPNAPVGYRPQAQRPRTFRGRVNINSIFGGAYANGRYPSGGGGSGLNAPRDDGPARDALNNMATAIGRYNELRQGTAGRLEDSQSFARGASALATARAGGDPGSTASRQLSTNATIGALNSAMGREAAFQRGLADSEVGGLGSLAGLENSRQLGLFGAGLDLERLRLSREALDSQLASSELSMLNSLNQFNRPGGGSVVPAGANPSPWQGSNAPLSGSWRDALDPLNPRRGAGRPSPRAPWNFG